MAETKGDFTKAPKNVKIDDKVVKKLAGEALAAIDGVLGLKGGLTDVLKDPDDVTRGLSVTADDSQNVELSAKIIAETGKNIPDIIGKATADITAAVQNETGLKVKNVCIEVADTMTAEEYRQQASVTAPTGPDSGLV